MMSKVCKEAGHRIRLLREKEIEMGLKGFSADTLYKISKTLRVSSEYLLSGHVIESENTELMNILNMFTPEQIKEVIALLKTVYKISVT